MAYNLLHVYEVIILDTSACYGENCFISPIFIPYLQVYSTTWSHPFYAGRAEGIQ